MIDSRKSKVLVLCFLATFTALTLVGCGKGDKEDNKPSGKSQKLARVMRAPLNETIEYFLASLRDVKNSNPPLWRTLNYPGTQPNFFEEGDGSQGQFFSGTPMKIIRDSIAHGKRDDNSYQAQVSVAMSYIHRAKEIATRMGLNEDAVFEDDFITRIHKRNFENRPEDSKPSYEEVVVNE